MNEFLQRQKHLAQRRRAAEARKKTRQLIISNLCASASLRAIVYLFTPSDARGTRYLRTLRNEAVTLNRSVYANQTPHHSNRLGLR